MMTEGRAGFRAFNEGTQECREADFLLLRRRLAEGAVWGEELVDEVLAQGARRRRRRRERRDRPHGRDPDPRSRRADRRPRRGRPDRRAAHRRAEAGRTGRTSSGEFLDRDRPRRRVGLAAEDDGGGSSATCSARCAPSSSAPSRAAGSSSSASSRGTCARGVASRLLGEACRRFRDAGVDTRPHDGAPQRRARAVLLPRQRLRGRELRAARTDLEERVVSGSEAVAAGGIRDRVARGRRRSGASCWPRPRPTSSTWRRSTRSTRVFERGRGRPDAQGDRARGRGRRTSPSAPASRSTCPGSSRR